MKLKSLCRLAIVLAAVLISCSKDDETDIIANPGKFCLISERIMGQSKIVYAYDNQGRIIQKTDYYKDEKGGEERIVYGADKITISFFDNEGNRQSNDVVWNIEGNEASSGVRIIDDFIDEFSGVKRVFDTEGYLIEETRTFELRECVAGCFENNTDIVVSYNYENGNLVSEDIVETSYVVVYNEIGELVDQSTDIKKYSKEYEYYEELLNKQNNLKLLSGKSNKNLIKTIIEKDDAGNLISFNNYSYELNEDGYVVKTDNYITPIAYKYLCN
ncbi:hypothetical protein [Aquimarina sp. MMG016]|uniref:hypothetical protein n=1 Tax=Aquimarina sp. MMG016 TaxID=2822690 RepID=UPI001B3A23EB|nr:hypothetical protein [Aquimarina sp. MMG016]MBQ4821592.1 hypothetical protein [Aquimarina sp. MMG016]